MLHRSSLLAWSRSCVACCHSSISIGFPITNHPFGDTMETILNHIKPTYHSPNSIPFISSPKYIPSYPQNIQPPYGNLLILIHIKAIYHSPVLSQMNQKISIDFPNDIPYSPILSYIILYYPILSHTINYYPILSNTIPY